MGCRVVRRFIFATLSPIRLPVHNIRSIASVIQGFFDGLFLADSRNGNTKHPSFGAFFRSSGFDSFMVSASDAFLERQMLKYLHVVPLEELVLVVMCRLCRSLPEWKINFDKPVSAGF